MAIQTFQGLVRSTGGSAKESGVTPSPFTMAVSVTFLATSGAAVPARITGTTTQFVMPKGAIPISILTVATATGGTNPTVDIGTTAAPEGIFNEVNASVKGSLKGADGTLVTGLGLAADTPITGRVGASAAASGNFTGVITFAVYNDSQFDT